MSNILAFGDDPDQNWQIKGVVYSWFAVLAMARSPSKSAAHAIEMSDYFNGADLPHLANEDEVLAREVSSVLLIVARQVSAGDHRYQSTGRTISEKEHLLIRARFQDLVALLEAWRSAHGWGGPCL